MDTYLTIFEGAPLGAVGLTAPELPAEFGARSTKAGYRPYNLGYKHFSAKSAYSEGVALQPAGVGRAPNSAGSSGAVSSTAPRGARTKIVNCEF